MKPSHILDNMTVDDLAANILDVWSQQTELDRLAGEGWYLAAHAVARDIGQIVAPNRPRDVQEVIGAAMIAVLSPRLGWGRNVTIAETVARKPDAIGALRRNIGKAYLVKQAGQDTSLTDITCLAVVNAIVSGQKVKSFFEAIAWADHADRPGQAVIDVHALSVAIGLRASDRHYGNLSVRDRYGKVSAAYKFAAARAGVPLDVMQATTWVTWRRLHNLEYYG